MEEQRKQQVDLVRVVRVFRALTVGVVVVVGSTAACDVWPAFDSLSARF